MSRANSSAGRGVMSPAMLWTGLRYVLSGGLRLREGHLPPPGHPVPVDFAGVGVAAGDTPEADAHLLAELNALGIRQVRLDFSEGDLSGPAARLLDALLAQDFRVLLHLVQPSEAASRMNEPAVQVEWRGFVQAVMARFGARVVAVEIGSTINRRRWAGYDSEGFFAAWGIAHAVVRQHNVRLAGPSVTDFEPLYNVAVLDRLARAGQLPDIHTDNLFSERVTEPERFDHRILGFAWATRLKVNLVKKARLLKKITDDFGIAEYVSPAAFWTLPRIQRMLPDGEQKQADYLTRYFVLCAASGAMRQAYWGPLVCAREGLIDDGSAAYPALERITHYRSMTGKPENFRRRPAFEAMQAFQRLIPGSRYEGALLSAEGIELHVFRSAERCCHVVWTANGRAVPLGQLYGAADLQRAAALNRDGEVLSSVPDFATESPLYLTWPATAEIRLCTDATPEVIALHGHQPGKQPYVFDADGWHGVLLASGPEEATRLRELLHPDRMPAPAPETLLRRARNAIWRVPTPSGVLVAKKPLKMYAHKRFLDRHKPSKARRSWDAAAELLRRGIATAAPVACIEQKGEGKLLNNYYLCEFVAAECSAREMMAAFAGGADSFMGIPAAEAYHQLCAFLLAMHNRGVFFRDLSGGNILLRKTDAGALEFTLIDINRAHFFNRPTVLSKRLSDLTRVCNKLHWAGREALVGEYLRALGQEFTWYRRLPFYSYDAKVWLKRHLGRKAIKRLFASKVQ